MDHSWDFKHGSVLYDPKRDLNIRFSNPVSADTNSSCPFGKEFDRRKDDSNQGMQGRY